MIDIEFKEKFPFLSGVEYREKEYVCIIQNADEKLISFYDFEAIRTPAEKEIFLKFGDTWWWESNRILPINIFIGKDMSHFRYCLRTVVRKDVEVVFGPITSLNNIIKKRIKRRQISLVKKVT